MCRVLAYLFSENVIVISINELIIAYYVCFCISKLPGKRIFRTLSSIHTCARSRSSHDDENTESRGARSKSDSFFAITLTRILFSTEYFLSRPCALPRYDLYLRLSRLKLEGSSFRPLCGNCRHSKIANFYSHLRLIPFCCFYLVEWFV